MSRVVVLGAGIGGVCQAFELREALPKDWEVMVINDRDDFQFTPSNPWVAVGWRTGEQISVDLPKVFGKNRIAFDGQGARRVHPDDNAVELNDGSHVDYDYLVIATGPKLAFDEIDGLGPHAGHTQSVCTTAHATTSKADFEKLVADPGPVVVGAAQGASCFGPAYEYALILSRELKRRGVRDKVPMYYVTPEPYIGHLGLDGVGDTKGILESDLRNEHIKWITNARIDAVEDQAMKVTEVDDSGEVKQSHELAFKHSMILPAFKGVDAVLGIEGLTNPRGFITVDDYQRNPAYPNVYGVGVCVAIPPVGKTPLAVGVPKTGYMIESMVTATTKNIAQAIGGEEPTNQGTWNAVCLADFGSKGVAFVAAPQIPPRNMNWASRGRWVHWAKVLFEKYFLRKVRRARTEPSYERLVLLLAGIKKIKA